MSITDGWDDHDHDHIPMPANASLTSDYFNGSIFSPERHYIQPTTRTKYAQVLITCVTKQKCKLELISGQYTSALVVVDHMVDVKWINAKDANNLIRDVFNISYEKLDFNLQELHTSDLVRMVNEKHSNEVRVVCYNKDVEEVKELSVKLLDRKSV